MRALDSLYARLLLPLAVFVAIFVTTEYIARSEERLGAEQLRSNVLSQAATLRARIEGELNSTVFLVNGVVAYIAAEQHLDDRNAERVFTAIYRRDRHIRNMALAPGTTIRYIYPLAGNERALGIDYRDLPKQWPLVDLAIREKRTTIAGPLDLVQGGRGIIARTPVFLHGDRYWGMVALALDSDSLFRAAGLFATPGLHVALRGADGSGSAGPVFFGNPQVFADDPVLMDIELPRGSWQLAAVPLTGWQASSPRSTWIRILGGLLALAGALANLAFLAERRRVRIHATHDSLTRLPNRKMLADRIERQIARCRRHGGRFALLFIDLDGFKPINDAYGHKAGDQMLQTIAGRLPRTLRESDTVARVGGDEFVVLLSDIDGPQSAAQVADKILAQIRLPVRLHLARDTRDEAIDASIGISLFPDDGSHIDALLLHADNAMYSAKGAGKGCVHFAA